MLLFTVIAAAWIRSSMDSPCWLPNCWNVLHRLQHYSTVLSFFRNPAFCDVVLLSEDIRELFMQCVRHSFWISCMTKPSVEIAWGGFYISGSTRAQRRIVEITWEWKKSVLGDGRTSDHRTYMISFRTSLEQPLHCWRNQSVKMRDFEDFDRSTERLGENARYRR